MSDKLIAMHTFTFNPKDNSGEQLSLTTHIYDNGDAFLAGHSARGRGVEAALKGGIYLIQELALNSYGNSAVFTFGGPADLTPAKLRNLADQLEEAIQEADTKVNQKGREATDRKATEI